MCIIRGSRLMCSLLLSIIVVLLGTIDAMAADKLTPYRGLAMCNNTPATVYLQDIDSGTTSPTGDYRWLDIADQQYSSSYRTAYNYTQATAQVIYETTGTILQGTLTADNLKPNFAYQLKLVGTPGTLANERIGLAGRWWQEEWDGSEWSNGQNLNNKGDGSSPNPNDDTYFARRGIADETSPTGLKYRYTGYLVCEYFITDSNGYTSLNFETKSSYHVLWKTSQRAHTGDDGPVKVSTFDPDPSSDAYDIDYSESTISIFGEWERLPIGGVYLQPSEYTCQIILTEESFHGSGGSFAGSWAAAMGAPISFYINTWESYSDYTITTKCEDFDNYAIEHTIYMYGEGFAPNTPFDIVFWDYDVDTWYNRQTEEQTSTADGKLGKPGQTPSNLVAHELMEGTDTDGTWHCVVYIDGTVPLNYDPDDSNIVAADTSYAGGYAFYVYGSAIPEFPTIFSAVAVAGLCFVIYWWMRRRLVRAQA